MQGSRPFTDEEIEAVLKSMKNIRDQTLFILGIRTGFRISELLSLRVENVMEYGSVSSTIRVTRSNMKGKKSSRTVVLHAQAKEYLENYLRTLSTHPKMRLFPFTRQYADQILKKAKVDSKLRGRISTHSLRKTFADKLYTYCSGDLRKLQIALGHRSISSTAHYVSFRQEEIDQAILSL